jgi:hypothetical protein
MTEAEWLACTKPPQVLDLLIGKGSERKLRLFACACARRAWHLLTDECCRRAVEIAERYADGLETEAALLAAHSVAYQVVTALRREGHRTWNYPAESAACAAWCAAGLAYSGQGASAAVGASWNAAAALSPGPLSKYSAERPFQYRLLSDIFGPAPFRPLPRLNPAWLAWEGGTVQKIATEIYEERDFDRLPILADALEEAGCDAAELLTHLRGPGPHVRACWAVDLVLGKE